MNLRRFSTRPLRTAGTAITLLCSLAVSAEQPREWLTLPAPDPLESFEVGSQVKLNGVPVRIKGHVSDRSVSELVRWYQQKLGGRWVENRIGHKTVLGQRQGEFFVTVELEPMLGGLSGSTTKIVTSVMDLRAAALQPAHAADAFENWSSRLPLTSKVLSHQTDSTRTHDALHLVAVNHQSLAHNVEHFRREFAQNGYREDAAGTPAAAQTAAGQPTARHTEKLTFSAPNTDAVVVLGRDNNGRSTVVLILNRSKR